MPDVATTPEEHTLLAIMALQREVNNGGYHQFFSNSSCEYALTVVPALESIGCDATAALTQKAIDALKLYPLTLKAIEDSIFEPNPERDRALDALDRRFYEIFEIEPKLFTFVESRQQAFVLGKLSVAFPPAPASQSQTYRARRRPGFWPQDRSHLRSSAETGG
jgi:hypothetical protein